MKDYQILKRAMLQKWLSDVGDEQIKLFTVHTSIQEWVFPEKLKTFLGQHSSEECIYLMTLETDMDVPVYIGKSKQVYQRWEDHLQGFFKRKKTYLRWWDLLVYENRFRFNTYLIVIPQSKIIIPPIPDFPTTVGSVEYQLISLASDGYSEYLLNREGNRR